MKIGIDVSQVAYKKTGVSNYLLNLVRTLIDIDKKNEYLLFLSAFRSKLPTEILEMSKRENVKVKLFKFPPSFLDLVWNRMHILPIESLIGEVDYFITSDWTEPPATKAKKATILYDLVAYKYPNETDKKITQVQRRKLRWVKKESDIVFCISKSAKDDAKEILGLEENRLKVIYPGIN